MLSFNNLILHNFGSYGHSELNLHDKGFCLVTGQNDFAKDNALSNGSGKSFLWNAICFALCGETINGLHTNLKNINIVDDPDCWVQLNFSEGNDHYTITRQITPRSDLKILKNNIDVSGKGIRESEKKLNELLPDLTKNLITSTIIIGQGMPNKFSSFSPSGRKELLEKLTKADFMIEDIKQRVMRRQSELAMQSRSAEDALLSLQSQARVHKATLQQKEQQLAAMCKPDFETQIASKTAELTALSEQRRQLEAQIIIEEQAATESAARQVQALADRAAELEAARKAYELESYECLQSKHGCQADINATNREITTLSAITDICPTCGQKIPGSHKPDLTEPQNRLQSLTEKLHNLNQQLQQYEIKYNQTVEVITLKHDSQVQKLTQEADTRRNTTNVLRGNVRTLAAQESSLRDQFNRLVYEQETWDSRYEALKQEIENTIALLQELNLQIANLTEATAELEKHVKVIKKMDSLLKRDFRGFLLTNIIAYLNQKAKEYSNIVFGTKDLEICLDGNDLNISYCGKMFDNLSGGEKQRVDLILQFTIRSMLTAYLNFNSNILVLDEITDFLDKKSCAAILELITKELNTIESVFIVSHHASALELPIDSELKIRKNEIGISEIISGV